MAVIRLECSGKTGSRMGFAVAAMVFLAAHGCPAATDPFPAGFSMTTLGAVIDTRGPGGRQPWSAAAFQHDSSRLGVAFCATSFFGTVDDPDLYRAWCGAWYRMRGFTIKTAFSHFNALDVYAEESGFLSIGSVHLKPISLSVQLTGTLLRCTGFPLSHRCAAGGVSAWIPWSWAGVSLNADHVKLYNRNIDGALPPPAFRAGVHTPVNRYGSQGAQVRIIPSDQRPVCFTIGEAYRITRSIAFDCAIANNPVLISAGLTVALGRATAAVALASHPVLGWSQGVAAEYGILPANSGVSKKKLSGTDRR